MPCFVTKHLKILTILVVGVYLTVFWGRVLYIYIQYIYIYIYIYIRCVYVYIYIYVCVCVYVCRYVWYGMVWHGMVWYGMYVCTYVCMYVYIYIIYIYMKWFCWRLPKKSSISLSLLQEREGTVENRSKAIVLPFLFSDENRMMQSQRDNESIMECVEFLHVI